MNKTFVKHDFNLILLYMQMSSTDRRAVNNMLYGMMAFFMAIL